MDIIATASINENRVIGFYLDKIPVLNCELLNELNDMLFDLSTHVDYVLECDSVKCFRLLCISMTDVKLFLGTYNSGLFQNLRYSMNVIPEYIHINLEAFCSIIKCYSIIDTNTRYLIFNIFFRSYFSELSEIVWDIIRSAESDTELVQTQSGCQLRCQTTSLFQHGSNISRKLEITVWNYFKENGANILEEKVLSLYNSHIGKEYIKLLSMMDMSFNMFESISDFDNNFFRLFENQMFFANKFYLIALAKNIEDIERFVIYFIKNMHNESLIGSNLTYLIESLTEELFLDEKAEYLGLDFVEDLITPGIVITLFNIFDCELTLEEFIKYHDMKGFIQQINKHVLTLYRDHFNPERILDIDNKLAAFLGSNLLYPNLNCSFLNYRSMETFMETFISSNCSKIDFNYYVQMINSMDANPDEKFKLFELVMNRSGVKGDKREALISIVKPYFEEEEEDINFR